MGVGPLEQRVLAQFLSTSPPMSSVLTLGRQRISERRFVIRDRSFLAPYVNALGAYEWLDEALIGRNECDSCDSLDVSAYEKASILADLSVPDLADKLNSRFDVVMDFGTTEHVIDIFTALRNSFGLVREGGYLLMSVPTDGFSGHGYWQLSPAAIFDLFEDGHASSVCAFFACPATPNVGMVAVPNPRESPGMRSRPPTPPTFPAYLVALVRKDHDLTSNSAFQADYLAEWGSPDERRSASSVPDDRQLSFRDMSLRPLGTFTSRQLMRQVMRNVIWTLLPRQSLAWWQRDKPKT